MDNFIHKYSPLLFNSIAMNSIHTKVDIIPTIVKLGLLLGRSETWFETIIKYEVDNTTDRHTLFRTDSFATKMLN